jgi:aldose 1-epimerase
MYPSGTQYELAHEGYAATVTAVGATLRRLTHDGRPLVVGFDVDQPRPAFRGTVLVPWPNRVADGRYAFDGELRQLAVTEPARGNAIHGLVAWARFDLVEHVADRVVLRHVLVPQPGYPHELEVTVTYALGVNGLSWSISTRNIGERPAPYGCAPHPYLVGGPGRVDDWTLEVPAGEFLRVTEDRGLPSGVSGVGGTAFDFRTPRVVADLVADHAFTGLKPGDDGTTTVRVTANDGHGTALTWDPAVSPWVQIHTADSPDPASHRIGLAVEPMTCPPDAFNSGTDLVILAPGSHHTATWTLSAI